MQGRLQPNTRILVRVIRDELRRLLDRLVEVGVGEDEAAAVLVDVVVGPDGFFNGHIFIKEPVNILVFQLRNLHLLLVVRLDFFFVELDRRHSVRHHLVLLALAAAGLPYFFLPIP